MLYCFSCKEKHGWSGHIICGVLNCQVCGATSLCYSAPAQDLLPNITIAGENTIMYPAIEDDDEEL